MLPTVPGSLRPALLHILLHHAPIIVFGLAEWHRGERRTVSLFVGLIHH